MIRVVLLSAPRGAGKSTACQRLVELARGAGLSLGGILAPAHYDTAGDKQGIVAVDVFTQERFTLALVEPDPQLATIGRFRFDPAVMAWAVRSVLRALDAPLDAVIADEIGPLELVKQQGFAPVLEHLPRAQARVVILVVRSELLLTLQERLSAFQPAIVPLTLSNRDQVPTRLLEEVWSARS